MRIAPNHRVASWSVAMLALLLLPKSLWGQQSAPSADDGFGIAIVSDSDTESEAAEPLDGISFVPHWNLFAPFFAGGDSENDPRRRFVVSYEQMLFGMSPTLAAGTIEPKPGHAAGQSLSALAAPAAAGNDTQSFAQAVLQNLGGGALNSLAPNLGSGSRLEVSRMDTDNTGWSVSLFDLNSPGTNAQSPDTSHQHGQNSR
ncbi:MAG TPA: hypothetical protein VMF30_04160 [Pirellulales bacterium]|nr:hypothetical protein [Pirellulales bacterium]